MQVTEGHLFSQMSFRDVEDTDERLILELDTGPELVNRRGALQGGLVATLIDIAAGRLADRHVTTGHDVTTADMTVHFLAPIIEGPPAPSRPSSVRENACRSSLSTSQTSPVTGSPPAQP